MEPHLVWDGKNPERQGSVFVAVIDGSFVDEADIAHLREDQIAHLLPRVCERVQRDLGTIELLGKYLDVRYKQKYSALSAGKR